MTHATNQPANPERRGFLQWLTLLAGTVAGLLLAVPLVGYLLGPLRRREVKWHRAGKVGDFPVGETRLVTFPSPLRQRWDGVTGNTGVYVRHLGPGEDGVARFLVFAMNCAHLGCPVSWFPQSGLFLCPCHGGVYYENGERASGPPPRGLFHCPHEVRHGELWVQAPHFPTLQDTLTKPA
jgi:Rieske Fe-S protein